MFKKLLFFIALPLAINVSSCSEDDEPTEDNLTGSKWELISADEIDFNEDTFENGLTIEFKENGECVFTPTNWPYSKWSINAGQLKIVLGQGYPDDYMEGSFTINGKTATYTYSWADCDGEWVQEEIYTMTLKKI